MKIVQAAMPMNTADRESGERPWLEVDALLNESLATEEGCDEGGGREHRARTRPEAFEDSGLVGYSSNRAVVCKLGGVLSSKMTTSSQTRRTDGQRDSPGFQSGSSCPAAAFAARARMKSRSERRFR